MESLNKEDATITNTLTGTENAPSINLITQEESMDQEDVPLAQESIVLDIDRIVSEPKNTIPESITKEIESMIAAEGDSIIDKAQEDSTTELESIITEAENILTGTESLIEPSTTSTPEIEKKKLDQKSTTDQENLVTELESLMTQSESAMSPNVTPEVIEVENLIKESEIESMLREGANLSTEQEENIITETKSKDVTTRIESKNIMTVPEQEQPITEEDKLIEELGQENKTEEEKSMIEKETEEEGVIEKETEEEGVIEKETEEESLIAEQKTTTIDRDTTIAEENIFLEQEGESTEENPILEKSEQENITKGQELLTTKDDDAVKQQKSPIRTQNEEPMEQEDTLTQEQDSLIEIVPDIIGDKDATEEEDTVTDQRKTVVEPEKIVIEEEEEDDAKIDQEITITGQQKEQESLVTEPENASDSDAEPTCKRMKQYSTQQLIDLLECDDPDNFVYSPLHVKICDLENDVSRNNGEVLQDADLKNEKGTDKPVFMHIDTERDQDKTASAAEQDEVAVDPIGEPSAEWVHDDAECIIPDASQTQEEQDTVVLGTANDSGDQLTASRNAVEVVDVIENPEWEGKYVVNISNRDEQRICMICTKEEVPKYRCTLNRIQTFICSESCLKQLKEQNVENVIVRDIRVKNFAPPPQVDALLVTEAENYRHCVDCGLLLTNPDTYLTWECLEFCDTKCLKNYQKRIGSYCAACQIEVPEIYLGKYCVRFGFNVRQFCSGTCLLKYKKGLKICSYCREDIQEPSETLPSDSKVKLREFCSEKCRESYTTLKDGKKVTGACAVCHKEKVIEIEFCDTVKGASFCSEPCFVAFKYVNNIEPEKCGMCAKYYRKKDLPLYMARGVGVIVRFCSKICENVYVNIYRKIVSCCWCKVKKYNFDMIQRFDGTQSVMWCSLNCHRLYENNCTPSIAKRRCAVCLKHGNMVYHITSEVGLKSFCSYKCVREHQTKSVPTLRVADINTVPTIIKRVTRKALGRKQFIPDAPAPLPIITSVRSLATTPERVISSRPISPEVELPTKYVIVIRPPDVPDIRNVSTTVKPQTTDEETNAKPPMVDKETQTDIFNPTDMEVVPVPIYVPQPIHMFNFLYIKPTPFPIPIPVPILMPLTKTGTSGILKEVKTAQPTPSDPYEADLLVMAQLVADANDKDIDEEQAADSEPEDTAADDPPYSPEPQEQSTSFGDDVLQMALHMATDFSEPAVDLEGALTANTITATTSNEQVEETTPARPERASRGTRRRGRTSRGGRGRGRGRPSTQQPAAVSEPTPEPPSEPTEKPDANMCLKYTFGVNAWKQWVTNKNNELEKSSRRVKLFKTDLLQLTSDELNYSLCLFIKEVRKPNGAEYAPDTIYYLCLGIQQYLFENGRIDNIFCDPYYETFTDCLNDICKKFSTLYNDSQYIVTRVEEEHLWESKQLGAHSPHVLLSTLMFFNTKHFNLTNVEEHMQLSFSHIMKHWKRVPNTTGASKNSSSRNILLRFYPPQSAVDGNRKKKVYEQQENEENPIRCPVKLYEFYLSKCPESVKTRNDVFYLQPERSCVPDSPVWYSTMALGKESLEKMLHRVKMVKEINVALLSS